jgi:hypothetical protein
MDPRIITSRCKVVAERSKRGGQERRINRRLTGAAASRGTMGSSQSGAATCQTASTAVGHAILMRRTGQPSLGGPRTEKRGELMLEVQVAVQAA